MNHYIRSTASKQPERFPEVYPKEIIKGDGQYICDEAGNVYLDYCLSLGPIILGHRYPKVNDAVIKTIKDEGNIFSLQHPKERQLADLLCQMLPGMDKCQFFHNGRDACDVAIRLARAYTGRETILSFSYHGMSDGFLAITKTDKGIPQELKKYIADFDYNDIKRIEKLFKKYGKDIAGVILEVHTICRPENDFLQKLQDICNQYKAVLIADEVVSFPRYPKFSASALYGVNPDLICVSKGMANGFAISALLGTDELMGQIKDGGVFSSTTFGGNLVGVSAAIATLTEVIEKNVPQRLSDIGKLFRDNIPERNGVKLVGIRARQFFEFEKEENRWKLWQYCIERGILFHIPIFFSYSHTEADILKTAIIVNEAIDNFDKIEVKGRVPSEVFRKV